MGGYNHQPTKKTSLELTVPAARALTTGQALFLLGNTAIEDCILAQNTHFGAQRQHLIDAADNFGRSSTQLGLLRTYAERLLDVVFRADYSPFDPDGVGLEVRALVAELQGRKMLGEDDAAAHAVEIVMNGGYGAMFSEIIDLIDQAIDCVDRLRQLTIEMADGPAGTQGYFWELVDDNRVPWRQHFARAATAYSTLVSFWATTAFICTECHLLGINAPSILVEASTGVETAS